MLEPSTIPPTVILHLPASTSTYLPQTLVQALPIPLPQPRQRFPHPSSQNRQRRRGPMRRIMPDIHEDSRQANLLRRLVHGSNIDAAAARVHKPRHEPAPSAPISAPLPLPSPSAATSVAPRGNHTHRHNAPDRANSTQYGTAPSSSLVIRDEASSCSMAAVNAAVAST